MALKFGTFGNDVLSGTVGDDTLQALPGDDEVRGRGGNDILFGDWGDDVLWGGRGNDTLHGGAGNDELKGGTGNDTAAFATTNDVIVDLGGFAYADSNALGLDYLIGIENITTGAGDDTIRGNDFANVLSGADGDDELEGDGGDDALQGGAGIDDLDGGAGDDAVDGGAGNDWLLGDSGDDILVGGAGDDELNGDDWSGSAGRGVDRLTGGDGGDTFAFHIGQSGVTSGQRDVITDFDTAEGDLIRLHGFDDLEFVGNDSFSAANQVRYTQAGGKTFVHISTDADAAAEMQIEITGTVDLNAGDFIL